MTGASALLDAAGGVWAVSARAMAFTATMIAVGTLTFRMTVARRVADGEGETTAATWAARSALALLLLAGPRLWLQARGFVDPGDPVSPMMASVLQTIWGAGWVAQTAGALLVAAGAWLSRRRGGAAVPLWAAGALALVIAPALMGHAVAVQSHTWLAVTADASHTFAAASWTGALLLLTIRAAQPSQSTAGGATIARLITAFHPVALASACTAVVTGLLGVWLRVGRLSTLFHSPYGAIFGAKVALVAIVAGFGAFHSRRGAQAAQCDQAQLALSLRAEVFFALLTLLVTALLVGSTPEPGA